MPSQTASGRPIERADAGAPASYADLRRRFQPLFDAAAEGEPQREREAVPPREHLRALVEAGFAGLRVPAEHGGEDVPLATVVRLLADLAEADPNLAHVWRNHVSFIEDRRHDRGDPRSAEWLRRLGDGQIAGGGWSEPAELGAAPLRTVIEATDQGWRLTGTKYYSTGSVYADWSTVLALDPGGEQVVALVGTSAPGVTVGDDWDGFGQRLTGSGSVRYEAAPVDPEHVFAYAVRYPYQRQYYQSVMHAVLVGIGRAILRDGVAALRGRKRNHRNGTDEQAVRDPQLLQVIGEVSALVYAAESAFLRSLEGLHAVAEAETIDAGELRSSWIAVSLAQQVVADSVLRAATIVFDALGASGTSATVALDRHWRNARTLVSHNPRVFQARIVGDWHVNGVDPTA